MKRWVWVRLPLLVCLFAALDCQFTEYVELVHMPNDNLWPNAWDSTTASDGRILLLRRRLHDTSQASADYDKANLAVYRNGVLVTSTDLDGAYGELDAATDGTLWLLNDHAIVEKWSLSSAGKAKKLGRVEFPSHWSSIHGVAAGVNANEIYVTGQLDGSSKWAVARFTVVKAANDNVWVAFDAKYQYKRSDTLDPFAALGDLDVDLGTGQVYVVAFDPDGTSDSLLTYEQDLSRNATDAVQRSQIRDVQASDGLVGILSFTKTYGSDNQIEVLQDTGTTFQKWDSRKSTDWRWTFTSQKISDTCAYLWVAGENSPTAVGYEQFGRYKFCN